MMPTRLRRFAATRLRSLRDHSSGLPGTMSRGLLRWHERRRNGSGRQGNICMLHAGRCGSSVLADLLHQHPEIHWAGEIFEEMKPAYYQIAPETRAFERIAGHMYRWKIPYYGIETKFLPEQHLRYELANKSLANYLELLKSLKFSHFILLTRRNHLRRAVSLAIGTHSGQWNTFDVVEKPAQVAIDTRGFSSYGRRMSLLQYFESLDAVQAQASALLRREQSLRLEYETDIQSDPLTGYRRCEEFLGLRHHAAGVRLKKINPEPLSELISNYDEVSSYLKSTPYEWMLHS